MPWGYPASLFLTWDTSCRLRINQHCPLNSLIEIWSRCGRHSAIRCHDSGSVSTDGAYCKYQVKMEEAWAQSKSETFSSHGCLKKGFDLKLPLDGSWQSCWALQSDRACPPWNRTRGPQCQSRVPARPWGSGRPSWCQYRSPGHLDSCTPQVHLEWGVKG